MPPKSYIFHTKKWVQWGFYNYYPAPPLYGWYCQYCQYWQYRWTFSAGKKYISETMDLVFRIPTFKMYLGEKGIVCTIFNVCFICRASIKLRVCLSFMSWRKQSGFYLREKHFKDLSICYQVKWNRQLNAVYSSCSNIFPLHIAMSICACS